MTTDTCDWCRAQADLQPIQPTGERLCVTCRTVIALPEILSAVE